MDRGYLATEGPSQYSAYHIPLYEPSSRLVYTDAQGSRLGSPYLHSTSLTSTPLMANLNDNIRRTRGGRPVRTDSPHGNLVPATTSSPRSTSPRRTRRARSGKSKKDNVPRLTGPLSVITKDMNVPIRNMEAWVNRSIEVRRQEAERRKGYVTRPMNSFMLYRSAYAERTKAWCTENNHQIVSSVSGASWPMEPPEVRDFYNELAKIERINHQTAHPDYKFSPTKTVNRRKNVGNDSEAADSDKDPDGDWAATHRVRGSRSRTGRDASYPSRASAPAEQNQAQSNYASGPPSFANAPDWTVNTISSIRSFPTQIQSVTSAYQSHYPHSQNTGGVTYYGNFMPTQQQRHPKFADYQYHTQSSMSSRVSTPSVPSNLPTSQGFNSTSNGFVGLPGAASHHNLLSVPDSSQQSAVSSYTFQSLEAPVDPSLLPYDAHGIPTSLTGDIYSNVYEYLDTVQQSVEMNSKEQYGGSSAPDELAQQENRQLVDQGHNLGDFKYQPNSWRPDSIDELHEAATTSEFDAYWAAQAPAGDNVGFELVLDDNDAVLEQNNENDRDEDQEQQSLEIFSHHEEGFKMKEGKGKTSAASPDEQKSPKTT